MSDSPEKPYFRKGFMPFKIVRPALSSHIPYSINQLPRKLSDMIEKEVLPENKTELVYSIDPTKPATEQKIEEK